MDLQELIRLADEVLADTKASDEGLERLENYCKSFDLWFAASEQLIRSKDPAIDSHQVNVLLTKHERIAELAQRLQDEIPGELRKLKQRGKGILAYTDLLPKKISYIKPREG
ncbi:MAG: hypothetical protein J5J00_13130 [Deltaproteobacteria bacterium]|nr:hypothetical protein [Deltaproteobacteria bacterium]